MNFINKIFPFLLSQGKKMYIEKVFFRLAISFFILDLLVIALVYLGIVPVSVYCAEGMPNPLSIIYTPFSILLLYEVYLLIFYLPRSITTYIGKQYEIVTLILVRKLFHDIPFFTEPELFTKENILHLLVSLGGLVVLCCLIFCFYKFARKDKRTTIKDYNYEVFIAKKKTLSLVLAIIFIFLFIRSFREISNFNTTRIEDLVYLIRQMSDAFFNDFFVVLILIEVLLLLFTFSFSDNFNKVVRNSGFIISTMLLKLSFRAEGNTTIYIMLIATFFGVAILWIYKLFEKKLKDEEKV